MGQAQPESGRRYRGSDPRKSGEHRAAAALLFRRADGLRMAYAAEAGNWFWAPYLPGGSLGQTPDGTPIAGRAWGCISCHSSAEGADCLFPRNANLE